MSRFVLRTCTALPMLLLPAFSGIASATTIYEYGFSGTPGTDTFLEGEVAGPGGDGQALSLSHIAEEGDRHTDLSLTGGDGGSGGHAFAAGATAGDGGNGGSAHLEASGQGYVFASGTGGAGGTAGYAVDPDTAPATGGNGGDALVTATAREEDEYSETHASATAVGGNAADPLAVSGDARAWASAVHTGANGYANASASQTAGAGRDSFALDQAHAQAGTGVSIAQTAEGGAGLAATGPQPAGKGGDAGSSLTIGDASAQWTDVYVSAQGGQGGYANDGQDAGAGGGAQADVLLRQAADAALTRSLIGTARATGGAGGGTSFTGQAGSAGAAQASSDVRGAAEEVTADASASGGAGGDSNWGETAGGDGATATARAHAENLADAGHATARANASGGRGGYGLTGGNGAETVLADAVSAISPDAITLSQTATGGNGGMGAVLGGNGGKAVSTLSRDFTGLDQAAIIVQADVSANGGGGGYGETYGKAGDALASLSLIAPDSGAAYGGVYAQGGWSGGSTGGNATAEGRVVARDYVSLSVQASAGAAGEARASGHVESLEGNASLYVQQTAGDGLAGQTGVAAIQHNAVSGTAAQSLSLSQEARAGQGGSAVLSGQVAGQGGAAVSTLEMALQSPTALQSYASVAKGGTGGSDYRYGGSGAAGGDATATTLLTADADFGNDKTISASSTAFSGAGGWQWDSDAPRQSGLASARTEIHGAFGNSVSASSSASSDSGGYAAGPQRETTAISRVSGAMSADISALASGQKGLGQAGAATAEARATDVDQFWLQSSAQSGLAEALLPTGGEVGAARVGTSLTVAGAGQDFTARSRVLSGADMTGGAPRAALGEAVQTAVLAPVPGHSGVTDYAYGAVSVQADLGKGDSFTHSGSWEFFFTPKPGADIYIDFLGLDLDFLSQGQSLMSLSLWADSGFSYSFTYYTGGGQSLSDFTALFDDPLQIGEARTGDDAPLSFSLSYSFSTWRGLDPASAGFDFRLASGDLSFTDPGTPAPVPLPAALPLLLGALACLTGMFRRKATTA